MSKDSAGKGEERRIYKKASGRLGSLSRDRSMSTYSEGSIEEYIKRKRKEKEGEEELETEEIFRKSKKIGRSPENKESMAVIVNKIMIELSEIRKELKEQGEESRREKELIREEMRKMRVEVVESEESWRREREELEKVIVDLKIRVDRIESKKREKEEEKLEGNEERMRDGEVERKVRELERWREIEEKERRRKNIIVRGLEVREERFKEAVEKLWKGIGVEAEMEGINEIGRRNGNESRMVVVRMKDREGKREVMRKKHILRGREERIGDDMTLKERRMQWILERLAEEERRNHRRSWVKYGRIWLEGKWWSWNEEKEVLIDGFGNVKSKGEKEGGRSFEEEKSISGRNRVGKVEGTGREEEGERERGMRRRHGRGDEEKVRKSSLNVGFWNVAGVRRKDEGFWERLKEWDVVGLVETWLERKDWEKIKCRVPKEFDWSIQGARREGVGRRGRAIGGILMEVRKGLEGGEVWAEEEGLLIREVKWKREKWKLATVYISGSLDKIMESLKSVKEERGSKEGWIVEGDFNARTGGRGAIEDGEEGVERRSTDKTVNKQGERLIKWVEEEGWGIMNGAEGDMEGEMTFTGEEEEIQLLIM